MTIKSVIVSIFCVMIAGCASLPPVEDNQTGRQVIDIYDSHGNVKERMIILRFMIRIGRQRGMERCKNSLILAQCLLLVFACPQTPFGDTRLCETLFRV